MKFINKNTIFPILASFLMLSVPFLTSAASATLTPYSEIAVDLVNIILLIIFPALLLVTILYDALFLRKGTTWKLLLKNTILRTLFGTLLIAVVVFIWLFISYSQRPDYLRY